ncbi:MAG: hypothetical protein WD749_08930 [Phycisphaerales bacterium]
MGFAPANILPPRLVDQLQRIAPSRDRHSRIYPCKLVLIDTSVIERALLIEEAHGLRSKGIALEDIALIEETPWRLPRGLANALYDAGESGMGYAVFKMKLRDGRVIASHNSGALVDYPGLPQGVRGSDVVEVYPHLGRETWGTNDFFAEPDFVVLHFVFPAALI